MMFMDKQAHILVSTVTLLKNFCRRKLAIRVGLTLWVYKSLTDTERLSGVLFIKLFYLQRKNVAKQHCAAYTLVCPCSCLRPFWFIKYVQCQRNASVGST